jgi:hypothetical protein
MLLKTERSFMWNCLEISSRVHGFCWSFPQARKLLYDCTRSAETISGSFPSSRPSARGISHRVSNMRPSVVDSTSFGQWPMSSQSKILSALKASDSESSGARLPQCGRPALAKVGTPRHLLMDSDLISRVPTSDYNSAGRSARRTRTGSTVTRPSSESV